MLKELDKMNLYVTGTCMKNRLPKELVITKSTREFKDMNRGDYKMHKYTYEMDNGSIKNYGLVAWKDRDIVYCLTNVTPTVGTGSCYRRSTGGRILLERPNVIEEYNRYMGGVDIADQRRLHSNCTIMGQHRWWLKLLFYLLDVSTANALILYKSTLEESDRNALNIDAYKKKLVYGWLGTRMEEVPTAPTTIHELIRTDNSRHYCVYCAVDSVQPPQRTRFRCNHPDCNLPLCSVGTGKTEVDCFALSHSSEHIRQICMKKHEAMLLRTNKNKK